MLHWLKEQWRLVRVSYDPDESMATCSPMAILLGPGAFALAIVVFTLIPSVGLKDLWLPLAVVATGAVIDRTKSDPTAPGEQSHHHHPPHHHHDEDAHGTNATRA